jgi:outer membrane biosynthesis protein TonB
MTWFGRLLGLIVALGGFAAAHVLVQTSSAQVPPVPTVSVTVPTLPVPTVPVPPPPTTTVPVPTLPAPTVPVPVPPAPTAPLPPPPATTAPAVQLPPATVPPAPRPPPTTTAGSSGSTGSTGSSGSIGSAGASGSASQPAPTTGTASPSPTGRASSSSGSGYARSTGGRVESSASGPQSTRRTARTLAAKRHVTRGRVSVRLGFRLPKADRVFLIVRGPAPSCRVAGYIPVRGRKGANTVVFAGRVHGHRLEPGIYLISLSPSRRLAPGAATEYVRVVSPRRSLPLPEQARKPSCNEAGAFAADPTARILLAEALPQAATSRPTAKVAGAAVESPTVGKVGENDDGASGLLPDSGVLGAATGDAGEGPFLTIAVLTLVAALLLTMLALVARFLRGTWNP